MRSSSCCSELLGLFKRNGEEREKKKSASTSHVGSPDRHQPKTHSAFSVAAAATAAAVAAFAALAAAWVLELFGLLLTLRLGGGRATGLLRVNHG